MKRCFAAQPQEAMCVFRRGQSTRRRATPPRAPHPGQTPPRAPHPGQGQALPLPYTEGDYHPCMVGAGLAPALLAPALLTTPALLTPALLPVKLPLPIVRVLRSFEVSARTHPN